jgi:uncharacterized membrane protein
MNNSDGTDPKTPNNFENKIKDFAQNFGEQAKKFGEKIKEDAENVVKKAKDPNLKEEIKVKGEKVVDKVKEIAAKGNIKRIIVKNSEGKTIVDIPLGIGVITLILAPYLTLLISLVMIGADYTIEFEKRE